MEYYTVRQIAEDLSVSEETVRRWLRTKVLPGEDLGPKQGWRVPADAYQTFKARYRGTAAGVASAALAGSSLASAVSAGAALGAAGFIGGTGAIIGALLGSFARGLKVDRREVERALDAREVEIRLREAEIETLKAHVRMKEAERAQLKQEFEALQKMRTP